MARFVYPQTRRDESVVESLHGRNVADPYRWLEDPDSKETTAWVAEQNKVTQQHLDSLKIIPKLRERFTEAFNYERFSSPQRAGPRYFFYKNNGLQNQSVLYSLDSLRGEPREFLDLNKASEDGTVAMGANAFSEQGDYFAYGTSRAGSDWQQIQVRRVSDCHDLDHEVLKWVKFSSISWTHDQKGFFYSRYPQPASGPADAGTETDANLNQSLWYHRLGTPQEQDVLVFRAPEHPKWMMSGYVTEDGKLLIISISESTDPVNRVFYMDLDAKRDVLEGRRPAADADVVRLVDNFEAEYDYIARDGHWLFFKSNLDAPRGRVLAISLNQPAKEHFRSIIPESKDGAVLNGVAAVNHVNLIAVYMKDVKEELRLFDMEGRLLKDDFEMPAAGTIVGPYCKRHDNEFFFHFTSFLYPGTILRYSFATGSMDVFRQSVVPNFEPAHFKTEQVFFSSKDGTRVPMYIISRKDCPRDGNQPTLLYGYGGFNISLLPNFSVVRLVWVADFDGVVAVPNLRGGGEYGEEWHKAGTVHNKQNVFDDMIAAGEFLVREKYTAPHKICINGGSNGGLLVAACINQRPDLFGAAVAAVGVLDMLRFHKFTIGYAWMSEYGNPDKKEDFETLIKYSPLHNVATDKPYPSVLLTTADHDDRVVPLHSFKFISELQYRVGSQPFQKRPLLIRIETKAGHGAGKPLAKIIEEYADVYAFIADALGAAFRAAR
jgi:prolyl oligopeptidase